MLRALCRKMFGRSLWVYHANSGGCNGCDIEVLNVLGPVEKILPVNYYIPGCPPRPEAILYGVAVALGLVDKKVAPVKFKQLEFPIPRYHPEALRGEGELVVYEKLDKVWHSDLPSHLSVCIRGDRLPRAYSTIFNSRTASPGAESNSSIRLSRTPARNTRRRTTIMATAWRWPMWTATAGWIFICSR